MLLSRSFFGSALGLLVSSALHFGNVAAQVTTACQPLNTTNCPADPAFGMDYTFYFNATPTSGTWDTTAGTVSYAPESGAAFTINKQGDSPTIRTHFYMFFGRVELWMKTAPGTGVISSVMFLSDDLDEIDWEFMGGNASFAETNYFGKGRQDFNNAIYYPVNGGTQADYHNYTTIWTSAGLDYYIDGQKVRTLLPKDANNTSNYPQTPMRLSLGIWAGGDPTLPEGTRQWAGGDTDYTKGPFTMYVRSVQITDYNGGDSPAGGNNTSKEYSYGDMSGSWQSIKVAVGNSSVHDVITAPPPETLSDKWNNLPPIAHTAIYASAAGVGAIFFAFALYYCIRQRRRGAAEAKLAEQRFLQERLELEQYQKAGINPDSLADGGAEYNAREMRKEGMVSSNAYSVPDSPTGGEYNEKAGWETAATLGGVGAAAAGGAMRSPAPLLNNGPGGVPNRSFSTPTANVRTRSPAPQTGGGYTSLPRIQSPGPLDGPGPQRSFTDGFGGDHGGGYHSGYGSNSNDGYWR